MTDLSHEANPPCFRPPKKHLHHTSAVLVEETAEELLQQGVESEMNVALQSEELNQAARIWNEPTVSANPEEWSDLDDGELEEFLLDQEEHDIKKEIWEEHNQDWLAAQEGRLHLWF
jgi:hypothetical protein